MVSTLHSQINLSPKSGIVLGLTPYSDAVGNKHLQASKISFYTAVHYVKAFKKKNSDLLIPPQLLAE